MENAEPTVRVIAFVQDKARQAILHFGGTIEPVHDSLYHTVELPVEWRLEEKQSYGFIYDAHHRIRATTMRINQGNEITIQMQPWFTISMDYTKTRDDNDGTTTVKVTDGNGTVIHLATSSPYPSGQHQAAYSEAAGMARQYLIRSYDGWTDRDVITFWA